MCLQNIELKTELAIKRNDAIIFRSQNADLKYYNDYLKRLLEEKQVCAVEAIVGEGFLGDERLLKVKWVGRVEPTWEPALNVVGADAALSAFESIGRKSLLPYCNTR